MALGLVLAAYGLSLLAQAGIAWSNPEYLVFSVPGAVDNGLGFTSRDLLKAFDPLPFDEVRPRFLNYVVTVLNVKFRLALYEFFIPPVNLSLMLVVHVIMSPLLLYMTVRNLAGSKTVALSAACLYLTSVGFLSIGAFFVQPGKVLSHPLALLLVWLLSSMHRSDPDRYFAEHAPLRVAALFGLNFIALSIDDTYAIVSLVACLLFWRLFLPRELTMPHVRRAALSCFVFFVPFLLFAAFVWKVAPALSEAVGAGRCDYFGFALDQSGTVAKTPLWPVFRDLATTAIASTLLVRPYPDAMSAVGLRLGNLQAILVALLLAGSALFAFVRSRRQESPAFEGHGIPVAASFVALVAYFVLQAVLQRFHVQITGSYYYASLSAIFVSIFAACVIATVQARRQWVAQTVVLVLMAFQLSNFVDLNQRWKTMHMPLIPYSLSKARDIYRNVVSDDGLAPTPQQAQRMEAIRRDWKEGRRRDLSQEKDWPGSTAWFLVEMNALSGFVYRDKLKRCGEPGPRAPS